MPSLPLCHWSSQLFDLRAPLSTDVPVLLLNQANNLFKGTDGIENEVEPVGRFIFLIISRYGSYSPATAGRRILQVRVFITPLEAITFIFQNKL